MTVANANPVVTVSSPLNGATYAANTTLSLVASFTDAGKNDVHTCSVDWGDGNKTPTATVTETAGSGSGRCSATHVYKVNGQYQIVVSVNDGAGAGTAGPKISIIGGTTSTTTTTSAPRTLALFAPTTRLVTAAPLMLRIRTVAFHPQKLRYLRRLVHRHRQRGHR